jgi:hypothetical protein
MLEGRSRASSSNGVPRPHTILASLPFPLLLSVPEYVQFNRLRFHLGHVSIRAECIRGDWQISVQAMLVEGGCALADEFVFTQN